MRRLVLTGVLALLWCVLGAGVALAAAPSFVPVPGAPFPGENDPVWVAFSPDGSLLATANAGGNDVSMFAVNRYGALTAVAGTPSPAGRDPASVAFSPDGRLLVATNSGDGTLSVFSVGAGGSLSQVPGSPFPTGRDPTGVSFSPGGGFLAVSNTADATVSLFSVDPRGRLTSVSGSPHAVGRSPLSLAFSPNGRFLAVGSLVDGNVTMFAVAADGTLSRVNGSPFDVGSVASLAFSGDGRLLAIAGSLSHVVDVYSVPTDGGLTYVSSAPAGDNNVGPGFGSVTFSPDGSLLAVTAGSRGTFVYPVDSSGVIGQDPGSAATGGGQLTFSPNGLLLASPGQFDRLWVASQPPSAVIIAPPAGETFDAGEPVPTSFSCSDAPGHAGIASCMDSQGAEAPNGRLDTSTTGSHTYTVTATSKDGLSATATISYTVVPALGIHIRSRRARIARRRAQIEIACSGGTRGQVCRGMLVLTRTVLRRLHRRVRGHRRVVLVRKELVLARAPYAVPSGGDFRVSLRLTGRGLKLVRSAQGHRLRVTATATPYAVTRIVTLLA